MLTMRPIIFRYFIVFVLARFSSSFFISKMQPVRCQFTSMSAAEMSIDEIASKYKIVTYGQDSYTREIQCIDNKYISSSICIRVGRPLGLDLAEMLALKGESGLVLVSEVIPGSNADKTGKFKVGDALLSIADAKDTSKTKTLQGKPFCCCLY